jgi:hypothetical protein
MSFGTGIFLITAGAILAFGIKANVWWVDVDIVGVVLMGSGTAVIALTAWYWHESASRYAIPAARVAVVPDRTPVRGKDLVPPNSEPPETPVE